MCVKRVIVDCHDPQNISISIGGLFIGELSMSIKIKKIIDQYLDGHHSVNYTVGGCYPSKLTIEFCNFRSFCYLLLPYLIQLATTVELFIFYYVLIYYNF